MSANLQFAVGSVFVAVAALGLWVGSGILRARNTATNRLSSYGSSVLREEALKRPVSERVVAPVILRISSLLGRFLPGPGWMRKTQAKIVKAGLQGKIDANSWAVIRLLVMIGAAVLYLFTLRFVQPDFRTSLGITAGFVVLGFFGPEAILQRRADERQLAMQRTLPDILDLLVISVEAGLGFDSGMSRVVDAVPGPLSEEFFRMLQETRVGVARRDAMRNMMDRTDLDELRSFLLAMMQAEAFGVAIARVLRVQAEEMRIKRRQRAQEKAFAAPVKMVFPLVLCIFPALFSVLLGPAAISIWVNFINRR